MLSDINILIADFKNGVDGEIRCHYMWGYTFFGTQP